MSRTYSRDGRFYLDADQRSSDSYFYSDTSYSWTVHWTHSGQEVDRFSGSWDQGDGKNERSGVSRVSFSDDGSELEIAHADGSTERQRLPPVTPEEQRAVARWEALQSSPAARSAEIGRNTPTRLFDRPIHLFMLTDVGPPPGPFEVVLYVGDWTLQVPAGRNVRERDGLEIALSRGASPGSVRVTAIEVGPRRRHPNALASEAYDAFMSTTTCTRLPPNKAIKILGRKFKLKDVRGDFAKVVIDKETYHLSRRHELIELAGLRLVVRVSHLDEVDVYVALA